MINNTLWTRSQDCKVIFLPQSNGHVWSTLVFFSFLSLTILNSLFLILNFYAREAKTFMITYLLVIFSLKRLLTTCFGYLIFIETVNYAYDVLCIVGVVWDAV